MIGFICIMHKSKLRPNGFSLVDDFIKSLYKYCSEDFMLYLFDNESDEIYNVPKRSNLKYIYIKDQYERGLLISNDGVNKAIEDGCEIIIAVNDDVIFNETINDFIKTIRNHEHKAIGIYGCLSNGIIGKTHQRAQRTSSGIEEVTNIKRPVGVLNGFLLAFTRELYQLIKYPNGDLWRAGNNKWVGGGIALQNRAKSFGGRLFIIKNTWIFHHKIRGWKNLIKMKRVR